MSGRNPILCAIDTPDSGAARRLAAAIGPFVGGIKLGLEFFTANGREAVRLVAGAAASGAGRMKIIGVTVLTSLNDADLASVGQNGPALDQVRRLAGLARA